MKKKLITIISATALLAISGIVLAAGFSTPSRSGNLSGSWSLDLESAKSDTIAGDSTPFSNDGTLVSMSFSASGTTDRNGQSNKALSFDGTADYINIDGVLDEVGDDTTGTISMWVKPDDGHPADYENLFGFGDTDAQTFIVASIRKASSASDGKIWVGNYDTATEQWTVKTDAAVFPDGATSWTHFAVVQDGTEAVIYINGVAVAQTVTSGADDGAWFADLTALDNGVIGAANYNSGGISDNLAGSISDVKIWSKALTQEEVSEEYLAGSPMQIGEKGLIGNWSLSLEDGKTGSTTADRTPYVNDGTRMGDTVLASIYTTDRNSQSNKAQVFDDTTDFVNIDGVIADVASDTQGTWMAWVKPDDAIPNNTKSVINLGDTNANEYSLFFIEISTGFLRAQARDGGNLKWDLETDTNPFVSDGVWTHVALVQDGTSPVLYVNGIAPAQSFTDSTDITTWMSDLTGVDKARIGCTNYDSGGNLRFFDGSISNVKIYNTALTAEEIETEYLSYNPVIKLSSLNKGLIGRWGLTDIEGGTGSTTYDMTPYSNNGTRLGDTAIASIYTTDRNGQSNKAQVFDGSSDYVNIDGVIADVASDTAGTWMAWVKPDVIPDSTKLFLSIGDTSAAEYIDLEILPSGLFKAACVNGATQWTLDTDVAAFSAGVWAHVVIVHNGTEPTLYINGAIPAQAFVVTIKKSAWISDLSNLDNARIGNGSRAGGGEGNFFDGSISDVRIYNRALSAQEVETLYLSY